MVLAHLSENEKVWFSNLVVFLVEDDNLIENIEQDFLVRYRMELGLEELDTALGFEKALSNFASQSDDITKKSVFLELACITFCDPYYFPVEGKNLRRAAEVLDIDNIDDFIATAKELVPVLKKAFALFGEW